MFNVCFVVHAQQYTTLTDRQSIPNSNEFYNSFGGSMSSLLQVAILGSLPTQMSDKTSTVLGVQPNTKHMLEMMDLFESGKVVPITDKQFPLSNTAEAIRYHGEGHALGKVIVKVAAD